jgi:hypothetical protein
VSSQAFLDDLLEQEVEAAAAHTPNATRGRALLGLEQREVESLRQLAGDARA